MSEQVTRTAAGQRVQFPVLDSLRAVGALAVLTTHTAFSAGAYTGRGVTGTLLARLDVGVAIFFVLSGFLLTTPWLERAADGRRAPATGRYLWKRLLRVAPLYVLTAGLALALIPANHHRAAKGWVSTLTLTDTFVQNRLPDGLTQMWSLAVEASFYLVLPLIALVAVGSRLRTGRVLVVLGLMAIVDVWWHASLSSALVGHVTGQPDLWLPGYLLWFGVGIGIALLRVRHERGTTSPFASCLVAVGRQPGSSWVLAAGLMLVAATPVAGPSLLSVPSAGQAVTKNLIYAAVGGLLVLTGVFADHRGRYAGWLGHRWSRHLGAISYGVFCLHLPLLTLVMHLTGWHLFAGHLAGIWILTTVLSVTAAEVTYRLVERPSMRLKDLGAARPAPTTTASSGTSITY